MEIHFSSNGQEQGGRLLAADGSSLALHPQPMVAVHSGQSASAAFGANDLQHLKHSLGIRPLRSISRPDGEGTCPLGDMSEEIPHRGSHRSANPRNPSSTEAHPDNHGDSELHARDSNQANVVESAGTLRDTVDGNSSSQGGPTAGGMDLDDFQEGVCPRM